MNGPIGTLKALEEAWGVPSALGNQTYNHYNRGIKMNNMYYIYLGIQRAFVTLYLISSWSL